MDGKQKRVGTTTAEKIKIGGQRQQDNNSDYRQQSTGMHLRFPRGGTQVQGCRLLLRLMKCGYGDERHGGTATQNDLSLRTHMQCADTFKSERLADVQHLLRLPGKR